MTDFQTPMMIETNGINMAVYEEGQGFPVVFCHGWPELAYSWRHQMPALAQAGFHAIAPDQRGYGKTDHPAALEDYDMPNLTGDLIGLLDAFGYEKAVFVGHDWGGFITWQMPLRYPDRVAGVVGVNTPFMPRPPIDPIDLMKQVFGEEMYIVQFQTPEVPEKKLGVDVDRFFRFIMRKGGMTAKEAAQELKGERPTFDLFALLESPESEWSGTELLKPEEREYYVDAFTRSGFSGGVNWYRNFSRNWQISEGQSQEVTMPALMIMAENDLVLPPSAADGMEAHCHDLEKHLIKDCGHWTQQERQDELNAVIIDWLKRRF